MYRREQMLQMDFTQDILQKLTSIRAALQAGRTGYVKYISGAFAQLGRMRQKPKQSRFDRSACSGWRHGTFGRAERGTFQ